MTHYCSSAYTALTAVMDTAISIALVVTATSLLAWVYLILGRGFFWRMDQRLNLHGGEAVESPHWPTVAVVVPARDEAEMLPITLPLLLNQDYPGHFEVFLVDDHSTDSTGEVARRVAQEVGAEHRLTVLSGEPLAPGWTGKLWALEQGVRTGSSNQPEFILFTDADISHPPDSLRVLVYKAHSDGMDMVSLMAWLRAVTLWERLLIPAFVFFFAKLYPFPWVNNPSKSTAAAAGGCLLLRREVLERVGGLEKISGELIDDCAIARLIKDQGRADGGSAWLGLRREVRSLRPYDGIAGIWKMVARTAFTQLRYSAIALLATVIGMFLIYAVPVLAVTGGLVAGGIDQQSVLAWWLVAAGLLAWILMAGSYLPTLKWCRESPLWGFVLPLTALVYTLMTIDSARRWWRGNGPDWRGRTYDRPSGPPI